LSRGAFFTGGSKPMPLKRLIPLFDGVPRFYFETMPIVLSHVSTRCGHFVIGDSVGRSPNA
jgi:hypothetical protein